MKTLFYFVFALSFILINSIHLKSSNHLSTIKDNSTSNSTDNSSIISTYPFKVNKCTQVLYFEGKTLSNPLDFSTRDKNAFFTLSAFMINMFESKDSRTLLESINLSHITTYPYFLQGSKTCILFEDGNSNRNITLCTKEEKEYQSILEAYKTLLNCRGQSFSEEQKTKVITASCNGITKPDGSKYDLNEMQTIFKEELEKSGLKVKNGEMNEKLLSSMDNNSDEYILRKRYIVPGLGTM